MIDKNDKIIKFVYRYTNYNFDYNLIFILRYFNFTQGETIWRLILLVKCDSHLRRNEGSINELSRSSLIMELRIFFTYSAELNFRSLLATE